MTTRLSLAAVVLVAGILIANPVAAQDVMIPDVSEAGDISADAVQATIAMVESLDGIDDELRTSVLEQLRNAATQIQNRRRPWALPDSDQHFGIGGHWRLAGDCRESQPGGKPAGDLRTEQQGKH